VLTNLARQLEQASLMAHGKVATQNRVAAGGPRLFGRTVKKTLVFIDGENLFRSPKDRLSPHERIDWDAFLAALLHTDDELVRVYWRQPQEASKRSLSVGEVTQLVDPARSTTQQVDNGLPQRATQTTPSMNVQKKRYVTPKLQLYKEVSIEFPVVENIDRVHIVRLSSRHLPTNQSVSRTLTISGKAIAVCESQIEAGSGGVDI
jgi:hypothetical protein